MIITADFHTHTKFSHGKGSILDNAKMAKNKNISTIAITDHGFSHPAMGIRRNQINRLRNLCDKASSETGVKVLLGIESNILGVSGKTDLSECDYKNFDIFLAGVHRFILYDNLKEWFSLLGRELIVKYLGVKPSNSLIERNTKLYINTIKNNPIDILTHPGSNCHANLVEVAKCCSDYGTYFEISSRKQYLDVETWQKILDTGVNFIINSDAHKPSDIGNVDNALKIIKEVNIPHSRIVNINGSMPKFRFNEFKKTHL